MKNIFIQGFCLHLRHQENYLIDPFNVHPKSMTVLPTLVFLNLFLSDSFSILLSSASFLSSIFKCTTVLSFVYSVTLIPLYLKKPFLDKRFCFLERNVSFVYKVQQNKDLRSEFWYRANPPDNIICSYCH